VSDIVADAKAWLAEQSRRVSTHSENCHQWHDECLVARLVAQVERHRMTPQERAVVAEAADELDDTGRTIWDYLARTAPKEPSNG
jgi:DNA-directed RNA polymerase specialized sigma54-like protein